MNVPTRQRIGSLDLLKGLVIVIMALDHVRDYFHYDSHFMDPTNPATTNLAFFFTRFITHYCAPIFSFLAGVSAWIVGRRLSKSQLSSFLVKRGIWLIFVELVIVNFAWYFNPAFHEIAFVVIWILGFSMITLAALIHLPASAILAFSCLLIFGHNLLDPITVPGNPWWSFLHYRGVFLTTEDHVFRVGYPIIPWIAVMSLGYWFGTFFDPAYDPASRKIWFNRIGLASLLLFLVIRGTNIYGDPKPWTEQATALQTVFSFLNISKYPPSLSYLLVTLGGAFLFLANFEKAKGKIVDFFSVFGRVPFFFYILHLYLIHLLGLITAGVTGYGWEKMILDTLPTRDKNLQGFGYDLWVVYLIWFTVIAMLYPLCKWFDKYKSAHKEQWWLSYF